MCFLNVVVIVYLLSAVKANVFKVEEAKNYLEQYENIGNNSMTEFDTLIM